MTLTVSDLVGMPHLRLEFRAGSAGAGATVTWAQPSDLDTPWQWMTGGELLMKNGRTLPKSSTRQVSFLRALADTKACGLLIGNDPRTPPLTGAALSAADELRLPVIIAPYSVGFAAIGRAVADANAQHEARRLALTERVYNTIRQSVAQPQRGGVLRQLSRALACQVAVLDAETGDVALEKTEPLPDGLHRHLIREMTDQGGMVPGVVHLSADNRAGLTVEIPYEEPTVLVVYDFRAGAPDIGLLQHVATAVAVLLAQQGMRLEHDRRVGGELLAHLFDQRLSEREGAAELAERGLSATDCVLVASTNGSEAGRQQLHLALARRGIPNLLLRRSEILYALLSSCDQALATMRRKLGDHAVIGVSDPVGSFDRLPSAWREATWAAQVAAGVAGRIVRYRDATMLSVLRDTEEAQVVVDRVLGALLDYDAEHASNLTHTLDTFLRCQRSWQTAAAALDVHRQTVIYRIRRIEQIAGRNLAQSADIAELWLALRAKDLITVTR